jgi:DNA-binding IclR family transcriptional regulator
MRIIPTNHLAYSDTSLGVASIACETRLNVSTTFNILRTLRKKGIVVFDPQTKTYRLGLGVLTLSEGPR